MRTIAVATISFGLVEIPVRVYAAVESKSEIKFNLLHGACGSRLKQEMACRHCEVVVTRDEAVRGYEFAKDRYVTFAADELKLIEQAEEPDNQRIEIAEFIGSTLDDAKLTFAHFDGCYFLGPNVGSEREYATLVEAMKRRHSIAVARHTTRGRTRLVLVFSDRGRLQLVQIRYAHQVRSISDIAADTEAVDADVELAEQLIGDMTPEQPFDLGRYVDEQQLQLAAQIQEKIEGRNVVAAGLPSPIVDVVDAMKSSLKGPAKKRALKAAL